MSSKLASLMLVFAACTAVGRASAQTDQVEVMLERRVVGMGHVAVSGDSILKFGIPDIGRQTGFHGELALRHTFPQGSGCTHMANPQLVKFAGVASRVDMDVIKLAITLEDSDFQMIMRCGPVTNKHVITTKGGKSELMLHFLEGEVIPVRATVAPGTYAEDKYTVKALCPPVDAEEPSVSFVKRPPGQGTVWLREPLAVLSGATGAAGTFGLTSYFDPDEYIPPDKRQGSSGDVLGRSVGPVKLRLNTKLVSHGANKGCFYLQRIQVDPLPLAVWIASEFYQERKFQCALDKLSKHEDTHTKETRRLEGSFESQLRVALSEFVQKAPKASKPHYTKDYIAADAKLKEQLTEAYIALLGNILDSKVRQEKKRRLADFDAGKPFPPGTTRKSLNPFVPGSYNWEFFDKHQAEFDAQEAYAATYASCRDWP